MENKTDFAKAAMEKVESSVCVCVRCCSPLPDYSVT